MFLILGLVACMTTPAQRVDALGKGNFEGAIEIGSSGIATGVAGEVGAAPIVQAAGRVGVSDRVDIGALIGNGIGFELQSKFQLTNPESPFGVAIAPQLTPLFFGVGGAGAGFVRFKVPVLLGFDVGQSQIVIGPAINASTAVAVAGTEAAAEWIVDPQLAVGVSLQVADNLRLHPEVGMAGPWLISEEATDDLPFFTRWAFTLGIQFGDYGDR